QVDQAETRSTPHRQGSLFSWNHHQSPLISRQDARSQRGAIVGVPPTPPPPTLPPLPPATSSLRSRFGSVGMPTPTFTEPTGTSPIISSVVLPSPPRSK